MVKLNLESPGFTTQNIEHRREFGNEESEKMLEAFLPRFMPGVERAEHASKFDDEKVGIDIIAYLNNGVRIAIQWTITDSIERRREKVFRLLRNPFAVLHDDRGRPTSNEKIPIVMLYTPKEIWGKAWNKGGGDIREALSSLSDPQSLGKELSCMTCDNLEIVSSSYQIGEKERNLMRQTAEFLRKEFDQQRI